MSKQNIGAGLDASFILNAANEMAQKGLAAYNAGKNPQAAAPAPGAPGSASSTPAVKRESGSWVTRRYGGLPVYGWGLGGLGLLGIGYGVVRALRRRK